MSELTIITNNHPRDVIEAYELTAKERKEFDYLKWDLIEKGEDSASFFRYKGELYDLGDIEAIPYDSLNFKDWDGIISQAFYFGIVFRYVPDTDFEQVVVGRYYT